MDDYSYQPGDTLQILLPSRFGGPAIWVQYSVIMTRGEAQWAFNQVIESQDKFNPLRIVRNGKVVYPVEH